MFVARPLEEPFPRRSPTTRSKPARAIRCLSSPKRTTVRGSSSAPGSWLIFSLPIPPQRKSTPRRRPGSPMPATPRGAGLATRRSRRAADARCAWRALAAQTRQPPSSSRRPTRQDSRPRRASAPRASGYPGAARAARGRNCAAPLSRRRRHGCSRRPCARRCDARAGLPAKLLRVAPRAGLSQTHANRARQYAADQPSSHGACRGQRTWCRHRRIGPSQGYDDRIWPARVQRRATG